MKECGIVRDLLPLYQEGLLHRGSVELVEEHLKTCPDCRAEREALGPERVCGIARDLLPLEREGLLSPDSVEFLAEHRKTCPDCRAEQARQAEGEQAGREAPRLESLRRKLRQQRRRTALLAVCLALALATGLFARLTERHYFSDPKGVIGVVTEGGEKVLRFADGATGAEVSYQKAEGGGSAVFLSVWWTEWDRLFGNTLSEMPAPLGSAVYFSPNNGSDDILLWGRDQAPGGGIITLPWLALGSYAVLALATLAVLGIAAFALRRRRSGPWLRAAARIPAAYLLGELLVMGFHTVTYSLERDFCLILVTALFLYPALWLGGELWAQRQRRRLPEGL